ncbi:MAG TPA: 3'-5' exonuclease, partial [Thermomicrobiales bacterium]|nr:3'-5' exonuclease [Thermomicrobiales bacterium]
LALAELFDALVERTGYRAGFDQESEEDLERWANVLEVRSDMERYDLSLLPPGEALPTYLEQVTLVSAVDAMTDDDAGRVTLITLHSAKGLEFPVVFIAGVEEGLLPISRAIEAEYGDPAPMEEERRLFYVGITRAKKRLYLTLAGGRATYGRWQASVASRFLAAVPEQHLHTLGRRDSSRHAPTTRGSSLGDRVRQRALDDWTPPAAPARSSSAAAPNPLPTVSYANGQRVFHPKFGEGVILEAVERRGEQELAIDFKRHGVKRLLSGLAPLEVIG